MGGQTVRLQSPPTAAAFAAVVGKLEGEGPLGQNFDFISEDSYFGEASWEKAESAMMKQCFSLACDKGQIAPSQLDYLFAGDLLNQCTGSAFALRDSDVPFFGLYGACSTMTESLSLAAMVVDGGFADAVCAATCSHFCSSARQFRFPLEYGGQRPPTAQWTVTGAGAVILTAGGSGPFITHVTTGKIKDLGITDANNMGAAMAPAAYDSLSAFFRDTDTKPDDYDLIITGDLGELGHAIVRDFFAKDGIQLGENFQDCGLLLYDRDQQDMHAGASGCGCSASVLNGYLLTEMRRGKWKKIVFAPTGALLSPTSSFQGESVPGICHVVCLSVEK